MRFPRLVRRPARASEAACDLPKSLSPGSVLWLLSCVLLLGLAACNGAGDGTAEPQSGVATQEPGGAVGAPGAGRELTEEAYRQLVGDFFTGVTALQVGDTDTAMERLEAAVAIAPGEPAAWANLALARLRSNDLDGAAEAMERAEALAPERAEVQLLVAALAERQGRVEDGLRSLRSAVDAEPNNLRARFTLYERLEAAGDPAASGELEALWDTAPSNLAVASEVARVAAAEEDVDRLRAALDAIEARGDALGEDAREQLATVRQALEAGELEAAGRATVGLRNLLLASPAYQTDQAEVRVDFSEAGAPVQRLLVQPMPEPMAAAPDRSLELEPTTPWEGTSPDELADAGDAPVGEIPSRASRVVRALSLGQDGKPIPAIVGPDGIILAEEVAWSDSEGSEGEAEEAGAAGSTTTTGQMEARRPVVLPLRDAGTIDVDNDGLMELWAIGLAPGSGLMILCGGSGSEECSVGIPAAIREGAWAAVWPVDVDLEGDLDLILAPEAGDGGDVGAPTVLRNNGDGTWTPFEDDVFEGLAGPRALAWFDVDDDGDPDVAAVGLDGRLGLWSNERGAGYAPAALPSDVEDRPALAVAAADPDLDGQLELTVLFEDGMVARLERDGSGALTRVESLVSLEDVGTDPTDEGRLHWADLDNNGAVDLVVSLGDRTSWWLADERGGLARTEEGQWAFGAESVRIDDVADVDRDGRLEILGLAGEGSDGWPVDAWPTVWRSAGSQDYGWQAIGLRGQTTGDQRNNRYGLGGEIALRAGVLAQARAVMGASTHFGLGEARSADVVRIRWPNGSLQGEFALGADQLVEAEQRLKGSCPWLFAWDGQEMGFVTDVLWRSPLGLRINAQQTAGVVQTRDRVRVSGEQLAPRDGAYDLRITAELWETHYFDHVRLLALDHPADTVAWVDERFSIPPPALDAQLTTVPRPVWRALDSTGRDMTDRVKAADERTIDTVPRGRYQGVAEEHWVELTLEPSETQGEGSAGGRRGDVLLAHGWVYPTDSSINVALAQGAHVPPRAIAIDVPDGDGGWITRRENVGFPAGKRKTMLIDLDGLFDGVPGPRTMRLRTTMEIYWDRFAVAQRATAEGVELQEILPSQARLRYRGFSETSHWGGRRSAERTAPEIPDYQRIATTHPVWIDLPGMYTRFGTVGPLLAEVDDRPVILNAGDELALMFPALPPPADGKVRTFFFESDGWVKDGDFNTVHSSTVHPLPAHDRPEYVTGDGAGGWAAENLVDDPVFQRHAADWLTWHTRPVVPRSVEDPLQVGP